LSLKAKTMSNKI